MLSSHRAEGARDTKELPAEPSIHVPRSQRHLVVEARPISFTGDPERAILGRSALSDRFHTSQVPCVKEVGREAGKRLLIELALKRRSGSSSGRRQHGGKAEEFIAIATEALQEADLLSFPSKGGGGRRVGEGARMAAKRVGRIKENVRLPRAKAGRHA